MCFLNLCKLSIHAIGLIDSSNDMKHLERVIEPLKGFIALYFLMLDMENTT